MTDSPTPDPHSSQKSPLGFDEFIGILIALSTIGSIFFWAVSRKPESLNFTSVIPAEFGPTAKVSSSPEPVPPVTASPSPNTIAPPNNVQPSSGVTVVVVPPKKAPTSPNLAIAVIPLQKAKPSSISQLSVIRTLPKIVPVAPAAVVPPPPAKQIKYSDIPNNFWATPFIGVLTGRGVFQGFGDRTFRPYKAMTRAEFAVRLDRAFNKPPQQRATNFEDVSSSYWAYSSIKESDITGFLEGYPKDYFRPEKPVTRTEVIVSIASGLDLKTPPNPETILQKYKDAAQIPKYARAKVAAATQAGLVVSSNPQLLKPNQLASRADVAGFLYQGLVKQGKVKKIDSKMIVKP
ncbi:S-layer homology domain-containing protein [Argonema antarcticum]|uniref:S-layer homology domain-containing protein n=1 Tax=Argonema antarcticum TaxID=2942763 RepID=UPI002011FD9D|nr:S-layer homology domain-containing protein [Argonema antarcticum]MCL1469269.1 S-layer homology domain-containing protein [Argonema antarcticum A004/B2]